MERDFDMEIREAVIAAMRDQANGPQDLSVSDDMVNFVLKDSSVGGTGEGVDDSGSGMCGAFAFEGGKIKVGGIYRARSFKRIEGIDVPDDFTGYAYVEVQMGASESPDEVKLSESYPVMESDDVSIMMLYKFKDGSVEEDYRGAPHVQMWE